ncbi:MAG: hypothetical protein ACFBSD_13755 [Paracoccaceae bacterium]
MSSNSGGRRSMDDVLSSIRKIIGADRKDADFDDDIPMRLGDPVEGPTKPPAAGEADPISLTPNMRVDLTKLNEDRAGAAAPAMGTGEAVVMHAVEGGKDGEDAVEMDEAALEDMIRRVVREEFAARDAEAEEKMRGVVRTELMGETGQNISRNVQKMIQAEVAKIRT